MNEELFNEMTEELEHLRTVMEDQEMAIAVMDELLTAFHIGLAGTDFSHRGASAWIDKAITEWTLKRRPKDGQSYRLLARWQEDLAARVDLSQSSPAEHHPPKRPTLRLVASGGALAQDAAHQPSRHRPPSVPDALLPAGTPAPSSEQTPDPAPPAPQSSDTPQDEKPTSKDP
ncbi:MAG: hypothetical protein M0Q49_02035 [Porticoccaceae bacterium]|nr:hypothetical protein [Porticoccaceae bacterium]